MNSDGDWAEVFPETHHWGLGEGEQSLHDSSKSYIAHSCCQGLCASPVGLRDVLIQSGPAPEPCAAFAYGQHSSKLLSFENHVSNQFGGNAVLFNPWGHLGELDSSIIPVFEVRRLWFRSPPSPAKDHIPGEWKSWHLSPALGTWKAVFFPPGYPALNTVIICYLQTLSILELNKKLGIAVEGKSLISHSSTCISFPSPTHLPPSPWFVLHAFFLSKNCCQATISCVLSCYPGRKVVSAGLICDLGPWLLLDCLGPRGLLNISKKYHNLPVLSSLQWKLKRRGLMLLEHC